MAVKKVRRIGHRTGRVAWPVEDPDALGGR
jgi:hypothetical protein